MHLKLLFLLFLVSIPSISQERIHRIHSIDPFEENNTDLRFLDTLLKNVKVVALGEQTHYDGATFDAKVRLIKYLHENLGFNVIAFESGIYDCSKADMLIRNRKAGDSTNYLNQAIFGVWNCAQVHHLASYMDSTQSTDKPMRLVGFDIQFAGIFARDSLRGDFFRYVRQLELETGRSSEIDSARVDSALYHLAKYSNYFKKQSVEDTTTLFHTLNRVTSILFSKANLSEEDLSWQHIMGLMRVDYRKRYLKGDESSAQRDSLMADNIFWYMENHPDEKIIIWSASMHIANSITSLKGSYAKEVKETGYYLKSELKNDYYSMVFTSRSGRYFDNWLINSLFTHKPKKKSVENYLWDLGFTNCFLDLSTSDPENLYLHNSKIFGNRPKKMVLPQVADGLFYIEEMYPGRYK